MKALINFNYGLGEIFLKLYARRYELILEKNIINSFDKQIVEFGKARDRYLEMMVQHNIDGVIDNRRFEMLQNNFSFEQERVDSAIKNQSEISKPFYLKQLEFMRECTTYSMQLVKLIIPVLSAIREELEIPFNEDSYRLIFEEAQAKQKQAIDEFIQKFMPDSPQSDVILGARVTLDVSYSNRGQGLIDSENFPDHQLKAPASQ